MYGLQQQAKRNSFQTIQKSFCLQLLVFWFHILHSTDDILLDAFIQRYMQFISVIHYKYNVITGSIINILRFFFFHLT